jgi:hypothetical protein
MEHLGLLDFLAAHTEWDEKEQELMLLNLMGRLLYPVSERKTGLWVNEQSGAMPMMKAVDKVEIHGYSLCVAALRWLSVKDKLEGFLYEKIQESLGESGPKTALFDLTNVYFEGRMKGSSLAQFGRSKEKRMDAPLVSIGILADEQGIIKRSHFYAGNVSEPGTLKAAVKDMGDSQGLLMDAGIATKENIEFLALSGIPYHCVVRQGFESYGIDYEQGQPFEHFTGNGYSYMIWLTVRQHEFAIDGRSCTDWLIFVKSEAKQAKEDGIVGRQKERFERGLGQISASLNKARGHKSKGQVHQRIGTLKAGNQRVHTAFDIKLEDDGTDVTKLSWVYDPAMEKRNGTYVIRTSEKVEDSQAAWEKYHTLTKIEEVNRCCKTDLNIRPVYHQEDETIKAHLFLTLLACTIVGFIRLKLAQAGILWSWKEIVRVMNTQKVVFSKFSNQQDELFLLSNWSEPEEKAKAIYDALQLPYKAHNGFFIKISPQIKGRGSP